MKILLSFCSPRGFGNRIFSGSNNGITILNGGFTECVGPGLIWA